MMSSKSEHPDRAALPEDVRSADQNCDAPAPDGEGPCYLSVVADLSQQIAQQETEIAAVIAKWTREENLYVAGATVPAPVGEMNRASADVVRRILRDFEATLAQQARLNGVDSLTGQQTPYIEPQCTGPFSDARDCPVHRKEIE